MHHVLSHVCLLCCTACMHAGFKVVQCMELLPLCACMCMCMHAGLKCCCPWSRRLHVRVRVHVRACMCMCVHAALKVLLCMELLPACACCCSLHVRTPLHPCHALHAAVHASICLAQSSASAHPGT